jgi:membrane protein implicated in regulation of membrane protease activity
LSLLVVATSLVIGANDTQPEAIQDCLIIAGWLLMLVWAGTLLVVAVNSFAIITLWIFRRVRRATTHKTKVGGGVADDWLDGPP